MVKWIKVKIIEINECNSVTKLKYINKNKSTISKINNVVKNITHGQEPDLAFLNQTIYASTVISTKLSFVKNKGLKRNVSKKKRTSPKKTFKFKHRI